MSEFIDTFVKFSNFCPGGESFDSLFCPDGKGFPTQMIIQGVGFLAPQGGVMGFFWEGDGWG